MQRVPTSATPLVSVAVAESGAVTAAATRPHIAQPALSRSLRQLEEQLGALLLDWGRNSAQLTELVRLVQCQGISWLIPAQGDD